jgi:hypothetical protein
MKAKHLKQHLKEQKIEEMEDEWGDTFYVVDGIKFRKEHKAEALKRAKELMEKEFTERYKDNK